MRIATLAIHAVCHHFLFVHYMNYFHSVFIYRVGFNSMENIGKWLNLFSVKNNEILLSFAYSKLHCSQLYI